MLSDIQIAQQTEMWHIRKIAERAGVAEEYLEQYGNHKAKIDLSLLNTAKPDGKLVLVTAITPTPAGAGFIVALTGDIMTMPGLPKVPAAENIDVDETGRITGLF